MFDIDRDVVSPVWNIPDDCTIGATAREHADKEWIDVELGEWPLSLRFNLSVSQAYKLLSHLESCLMDRNIRKVHPPTCECHRPECPNTTTKTQETTNV